MTLDSPRNQQHLPHKTQAPQRLAGPLPDRHLVSFGCGIFGDGRENSWNPRDGGGVHSSQFHLRTRRALARSRQRL